MAKLVNFEDFATYFVIITKCGETFDARRTLFVNLQPHPCNGGQYKPKSFEDEESIRISRTGLSVPRHGQGSVRKQPDRKADA